MKRERKTEFARPLKPTLRRIAAFLVAMSLLTGSIVYGIDGEHAFTEQNIDQALESYNPDYSSSDNEDDLYISPNYDKESDCDSEVEGEPGEQEEPDESPVDPDCDDDYIPDDDSDLEEKDDEEDEDKEQDEELLELPVQAASGIVQFSAVTVTDQQELMDAIDISATEIILANPITLTGVVPPIPAGITITAEAGGFVVASGATLTLNAALEAGNTGGTGIIVYGTLNMDDGATISGFEHRGVVVNSGGVFTMNGGTIEGNYGANQWGTPAHGAGVFVDGGEFTMNGGTISNNTATSGAGVSVNAGLFVMHGGYITNNVGGVDGTWGGGVDVRGANAEFVMEDGVIAGNFSVNGGGVNVRDGAEFTMNGGTIGPANTAAFGGGVRVINATFTLDGGTITDNIATNNGGGVSILWEHSEFIMKNGTVSNNNASGAAGGIDFIGGEFTLIDGTISENTAHGGVGGGIRLGIQAEFTMLGGHIVGNNAANRGGGIYGWDLHQDVNILGGVIEDNEAVIGGGIFLSQLNDIDVNISGVEIVGNSATDGAGIGIWGTVGDGAKITISAEIIGNIAANHGGGVSIEGTNSEVTISGSIIRYNEAGGNGGGIALQTPNIVLNISGSYIEYNTAVNGGGIGFNISGNDMDSFIAFLANVNIAEDVVFRGNIAVNSRPNTYLYEYKVGIIPDVATHYGYGAGGFTNHDIHTPPVPRLTKTADRTIAGVGYEITYTITVTNPYSNISFADFLIVDALNLNHVELVGDVDVNESAGTIVVPVDVTDGVITVEVTNLPADGEIVIKFTVAVRAAAGGSIVHNTAFLDIYRKGPIEAYVDVPVRGVGGNGNGIIDLPRPTPDPGPYRWIFPSNIIPPAAIDVVPQYITVQADLAEATPVYGHQAADQPADDTADIPVVVAVEGYQESEIEARINPQTGDNVNLFGLIVSVIGLLVSAAAIFFARRRYSS